MLRFDGTDEQIGSLRRLEHGAGIKTYRGRCRSARNTMRQRTGDGRTGSITTFGQYTHCCRCDTRDLDSQRAQISPRGMTRRESTEPNDSLRTRQQGLGSRTLLAGRHNVE